MEIDIIVNQPPSKEERERIAQYANEMFEEFEEELSGERGSVSPRIHQVTVLGVLAAISKLQDEGK